MINEIRSIINSAIRHITGDIARESKNIIEWVARVDKNTGMGLKYYKLLSYDGKPIYPADCHDQMLSDDGLHEFHCNHDILVGDYIRVIDETYHMGMAKVVKRVFGLNGKVMYLYCVNADEKDDYLFSFMYDNDCKVWLNDHRKEVETIMQEAKEKPSEGAHKIVIKMIETGNIEKLTSVDYWNIISHTKSIVYPLLGLEYHRPARSEFEMY